MPEESVQPVPPLPTVHGDGVGETTGWSSRRAVLRSGLALAAISPLAVSCQSPQGVERQNGSDRDRLERESAHALYVLPRDHKWHAGGIYETGSLQEWHYWTGFFKDNETGEEFGLFYNITHEGISPGVFQHRTFFSLGNLKTKEFIWDYRVLDTPLTAKAPSGSTSSDDFQYSAQKGNTSFTTAYRAAQDTWSLHFKSVSSNTKQVVELNLQLKTQKPYGYLNVTPTGTENENTPWTGQPDPATVGSISYYYAAPKQNATGTLTVGDKTRKITGSLWLEHQWGNFLYSKAPWAFAYVWSAIQLNDNSIFTYRQWYDENNQPLLNLGRYSHSTSDGKTTYGFGEAVKWEGLKTWKSPTSGRNFATESKLTTPFGTWYYTAIIDAYEMPYGSPPYGNSGLNLYEAPCWIRSGSPTGPIIGKAYLELPNGLTKTYPEKNGA